jgi:hypothetical protein
VAGDAAVGVVVGTTCGEDIRSGDELLLAGGDEGQPTIDLGHDILR